MEKKRNWSKRILAALGIVLLILVIVGAVTLYKPVKTVSSAKQIDNGIFQITYQNNYKLDKALASNITTEQDLLDFVSDTFFLGIPLDANQDYVACSAFLTRNEEGQYLTGRNFDYSETDLLAVYTNPADGYASIGMVPLASLNIGVTDGIEATSNIGRILMLASPYMCVDGINEKGLMIAVLDLAPPRTRQDTGKPKINTMVIAMLDNGSVRSMNALSGAGIP